MEFKNVRLEFDVSSQEQYLFIDSMDGQLINVFSSGQILKGDSSVPIEEDISTETLELLSWINDEVINARDHKVSEFWEAAQAKFRMAAKNGFKDLHQLPRLIKEKRLSLGLPHSECQVNVDIDSGLLIPIHRPGPFGAGRIINEDARLLYVDHDPADPLKKTLRARFLDYRNLPDDLSKGVEAAIVLTVKTATDIMERAVKVDGNLVAMWKKIYQTWFPLSS